MISNCMALVGWASSFKATQGSIWSVSRFISSKE